MVKIEKQEEKIEKQDEKIEKREDNSKVNDDLPRTEVVVAPGHSMRAPGVVTKAMVNVGGGNFAERVVDVVHRTVLPGQVISVFTKDVPTLVALGVVFPPTV